MSIDDAEHNPIVMTRRGNNFYVGTFGEDGGTSELAVFDRSFAGYSLSFQSLNPIVGLAWRGNKLYGVEIFPLRRSSGRPTTPTSSPSIARPARARSC